MYIYMSYFDMNINHNDARTAAVVIVLCTGVIVMASTSNEKN